VLAPPAVDALSGDPERTPSLVVETTTITTTTAPPPPPPPPPPPRRRRRRRRRRSSRSRFNIYVLDHCVSSNTIDSTSI
jgi:hypothetical protein